ncbi:MetQ/NlpA family ABC transporter substrate-binding protein [Siminovitchia fortis]|uniref:Metal ABC transporter substrate-binding protein n=1 Tax=Siminovitchia fortis TaxID=254758 RepID=A0A443IX23_9BACI|nr:MetQ/NlpA family ABC transporter substrate-binding protein [Siminovitchia fortis]RWR12629.1 metal ABC transporter substrate-binding protein [Siminovitchia fortis]WHY81422.1 MetQ/NlpA family ABC transporter substrate-binding protein [Siminovitchia fortis]
MKGLKLLTIFTLFTLFLAACGSDKANEGGKDKQTIKVGTSPGPYSELFKDAIQPILEDEGYKVELTDFTELLQADIALDEGSIDLNVDQHTAYYENFNKEKGAHLTKLTPIPTVPAGIFPGRKTSLDDVAEGDVIGIPKDPSNAARAYALLQKAELIKLKDGVELVKATKNDIEENKYNLEIREMDSAQIPRAMNDLDYGVIPGSIVYSSGLDASTTLLQEDILKDLELVAVVDEKNKDTNWAKAVKAAYESDEFKAYMKEHNKDDYWFIPEEIR